MNVTADDVIQMAAAALISASVVLFAFIIGNAIYAPQTRLAQNAYPIEIPDPSTDVAEAAAEVDVAEPIIPLLASADIAAGEQVSRACAACHNFVEGGANKVGPNLWAIVGAPIGAVPEFRYSSALSDLGGEWTYEALNAWLYNPRAFAAGTSMAYRGVKDTQDRANLVAYLRSLAASPVPLPAE
ncbi:MAG: cytochrome c family protein [Pseudomonadota bacterium]